MATEDVLPVALASNSRRPSVHVREVGIASREGAGHGDESRWDQEFVEMKRVDWREVSTVAGQEVEIADVDRGSRQWRRAVTWMLVGLFLSALGGGLWGCNISSGETTFEENDSNKNNDDRPDAGNDEPWNQNKGQPNANNNEPSNQNDVSESPPGATVFTFCSGGGVSSGDDYVLTHCTGAGEVGTEVAEGGGYRLEAGAFRNASSH